MSLGLPASQFGGDGAPACQLGALTSHASSTARLTVEDALASEETELQTLRLLHAAYRRRSRQAKLKTSRQVFQVLYLATVAAARITHGIQLSKRPTTDIAHDLQRAGQLQWINPPIRELLARAAQSLTEE